MESVIRIRGAELDENQDLTTPASEVPIYATAISPGSSASNQARGRSGERVAYTAFFFPPVDLRDGDKLRIRGTVCNTVILDWRSPYSGRRGQEVLCSVGKG